MCVIPLSQFHFQLFQVVSIIPGPLHTECIFRFPMKLFDKIQFAFLDNNLESVLLSLFKTLHQPRQICLPFLFFLKKTQYLFFRQLFCPSLTSHFDHLVRLQQIQYNRIGNFCQTGIRRYCIPEIVKILPA